MDNVEDKLYDFSESEIIEVREKFPKLSLRSKGTWEGQIDLDATYNDVKIQKTFNIGILVPVNFPNEIPMMIEIGGFTDAVAQKYNIKDKRDLHYNLRTKIACLCVKQEEKIKFPPNSNLIVFIENLVVPYLYGLSFYNENGSWPWGEYSHGGLGIFEYYGENQLELETIEVENISKIIRADDHWVEYSKQVRKPSSEKYCICGSRKPIRKCHPMSLKGMIHLNKEIERLGLNQRKLFDR